MSRRSLLHAILVAGCVSACTTWAPVPQAQPRTLPKTATLRVVLRDGRMIEITKARLTPDSVFGKMTVVDKRGWTDSLVAFGAREIARVEQACPGPGMIAVGVVGMAGGLFLMSKLDFKIWPDH